MNTSATRVQPHAAFKGGPNRVVDANSGSPAYSASRNSVGVTAEGRAASSASGNWIGITATGKAANSRSSRNPVGATNETAETCGPEDQATVFGGGRGESGFGDFPSRRAESGVLVEGAQRGRTRPSTAGGVSSGIRQVRHLARPVMMEGWGDGYSFIAPLDKSTIGQEPPLSRGPVPTPHGNTYNIWVGGKMGVG